MIQSHPDTYAALDLNLKKAQGMLKKIGTMLQSDEYCWDIAQQINATTWLLKKMNTILLKSHLLCCGKNKLFSTDQKEVDSFVEEFFRLANVSNKK